MAIAKITNWLKDPDRVYDDGAYLFEQYGASSLLKSLFRNGTSLYHYNRLVEALEEINEVAEPHTPPAKVEFIPVLPAVAPAAHYGVTQPEWDKLPEAVKDLYGSNMKLHGHSKLVFNQMRLSETNESRLEKALLILNERETIQENHKAIKDFHATGRIKETIVAENEKPIGQLSMAELSAMAKNIPTYLSKARKKLPNMPAGPKKNKVLHKVSEWEIQLDLLNKRLANAQLIQQ